MCIQKIMGRNMGRKEEMAARASICSILGGLLFFQFVARHLPRIDRAGASRYFRSRVPIER